MGQRYRRFQAATCLLGLVAAGLIALISGCGGTGSNPPVVSFSHLAASYSSAVVESGPPTGIGGGPTAVSLNTNGAVVFGMQGGEDDHSNLPLPPFSLFQNGATTALPSGFTFGQISDAKAIVENPTSGSGGTYLNGVVTTLTPPAGFTQVTAEAISASGDIAGLASGNGTIQAFVFNTGGATSLGLPAGITSVFNVGINNSEQVIGQYADSTGIHNFLWSQGTLTDLGQFVPVAIANGGEIAGENPGNMPATWSNGKSSDLPLPNITSGITGIVTGIDSSGDVVGGIEGLVSGFAPTLWSNGHFFNLTNALPANTGLTVSSTFAINDHRQILVEAFAGKQNAITKVDFVLMTPPT